MSDELLKVLAAYHYDALTRAKELARAEQRPADRVSAFLDKAPFCKFKISDLAAELDVSKATVRKVCTVIYGLKPAKELGRGWWLWKGAAK